MPTLNRKSGRVFDCEAALLYEVLTDYDAYAEWAPLIGDSRLLAREGDLAIAELELSRPPWRKVAVECIQTPNRQVLVRHLGGDVPLFQMEWNIHSTGPKTCTGELKLEFPASFLLSSSRGLASASSWMEAVANRLGAFLPQFSILGERGQPILELHETPDGLVCWFRGEKYTLQHAESEASA